MMNYKYVVESFYDDAKVTVETNDPEIAILEMVKMDAEGTHAHVLDDSTGEVLAIVNNPDGEDYATPEFALMSLGFLMAHQMEQEEEPAPFTNPNYSPAIKLDDELKRVPADANPPAELIALLEVLRTISEQ